MGIIQNSGTMKDSDIRIVLVAFLGLIKCERVPPEQLYGNRFSDEIKECLTSAQFPRPNRETCDISENKLAVDYACRYRLEKQTKSGFVRPLLRRCYCCGYLYSYVEYGSICTAYCSSEIGEERKTGLDPIITLPFNWGDVCPEYVTDYKGDEVDLGECPDGIEAEVSVVSSTQDPVLSFVNNPPSPTSSKPSTTTKILRRPQPQTTKVTRRPQQSTVTSEKSTKSTTFIPITETSSEKLKSKVTTFYPPGKNIKDVKNAEAVTTDPNQKVNSEREFLPRWSR